MPNPKIGLNVCALRSSIEIAQGMLTPDEFDTYLLQVRVILGNFEILTGHPERVGFAIPTAWLGYADRHLGMSSEELVAKMREAVKKTHFNNLGSDAVTIMTSDGCVEVVKAEDVPQF